MLLLVLEIFTGASMFYFDFPFGTETAHLVFASIIFGLQFYILLQNFLIENKLDDALELTWSNCNLNLIEHKYIVWTML